jgi:hypothetical protein
VVFKKRGQPPASDVTVLVDRSGQNRATVLVTPDGIVRTTSEKRNTERRTCYDHGPKPFPERRVTAPGLSSPDVTQAKLLLPRNLLRRVIGRSDLQDSIHCIEERRRNHIGVTTNRIVIPLYADGVAPRCTAGFDITFRITDHP